jgi:hypothetical protein
LDIGAAFYGLIENVVRGKGHDTQKENGRKRPPRRPAHESETKIQNTQDDFRRRTMKYPSIGC